MITPDDIIENAKQLTTQQLIDATPGTGELLEVLTPILSSVPPDVVFTALAVMLGGNLADAMMSNTQVMATVEQRIELFKVVVIKCYEDSYRFASEQGQGPRKQ
jgi:hypothetical protein